MSKIHLACILSVFLSLQVAEAVTETPADSQKKQAPEEKIVVPPFDLPEKDLEELRSKVQRIKPILEKDPDLARTRLRNIDEVNGIVPRIRLAHGYGTVINLPYDFGPDDIAIGAREKFDIRTKGNSLIIFPLKEFKSTNVIVFEKTGGAAIPHHYLLAEDGASGDADLTVTIVQPGSGGPAGPVDAIIRIMMTQRIPDKGSAEDILLDGRSPSFTPLETYPFMRLMKLTNPDLYVFLISGKVKPVGTIEFWTDPGNGTTIVASKSSEIIVRRVDDGKTFSNAR